jgi:hypothetical protein
MVYSKRDSKGQETNGNHDFRDKMAKNKESKYGKSDKKHFNKYEISEDVDMIYETDYMKYQTSINGRKGR